MLHGEVIRIIFRNGNWIRISTWGVCDPIGQGTGWLLIALPTGEPLFEITDTTRNGDVTDSDDDESCEGGDEANK